MNSMSGPAGYSSRGNSAGNFSNQMAGKGSSGKGKMPGDIVPKGYNVGQMQQFTPEMMQLFQQLLGYLGPNSDISKMAMGDQGAFEQMEAPAWRQFQEAQGQLGSRFSQLAPGAMSAQRGSGFQNAAGQLGSDFAMNLGARRQELQRQSLLDMMGMSNMLLGQRPYERDLFEKPQKDPALGGWGGVLGGLGGAGAGFAAGGPMGALYGAGIGSKAFSGL